MSTYRLNTLAVAVAFAFSAPSMVNAQEAPAKAEKNIEQIIVRDGEEFITKLSKNLGLFL